MQKPRFCIVIFLVFYAFEAVNAQVSTVRCKKIAFTQDTFILDTLPLFIDQDLLNNFFFFPPNRVAFKLNKKNSDSLFVCYRVLPQGRVTDHYQKRNDLDNNQMPKPIYENGKSYSTNDDKNKIYSSGSVARGISAGNNQGLLINSDLNLQMQGNLGNGVVLTAAVADNNSPLQPDGNTLQIQDFDRVFVKIAKDSWQLIAGDYFMQHQQKNHFLKYNKKSRGFQFMGDFSIKPNVQLYTQTHAAISRGRFARNEIQGSEGLQGPYRLIGAKQEPFIIVIAATEVVYLDGKPLARGEQNDYVINYNAGEISFNPNIIITRFSRIVVEFQYADQNYSRILLDQGLTLKTLKTNIILNYFIEQDNKNQPFQAENSLSLFDSSLQLDAKSILSKAGDDPSKAIIGTAKYNLAFDIAKILYQQIDSVPYGKILKYIAIDDGSRNYVEANFSLVGANSGNYVLLNSSANGRVYTWVAPINGLPQGNYEPILQLVAPKRQQLATIAVTHQLAKGTKIGGELAFSNLNANTFSILDKNNDDALGSFVFIEKKIELNDSSKIIIDANWEQVSGGFSFIERYRDVEFTRLWNRSIINPTLGIINNREQIVNLNAALVKGERHIRLSLPYYNINDVFNGLSPSIDYQIPLAKNIVYTGNNNILQGQFKDSASDRALLLNHNILIKLWNKVQLNIYGKLEQSKHFIGQNDTLSASSFQYQNGGVNLVYTLNNSWNINVSADYRTDALPEKRFFKWVSDAYNYKFLVARNIGSKRLSIVANARFLNQDRNIFNAPKEQFLLQRIEYLDNNSKKGYQLNVYLQTGSGREQKREFVFIEVPAGQGQYTWIDYNGNNVREINEFEIAVFKDQAKFVRVFNLTNDFIRANQHEANFSIRLIPANWLSRPNSFWQAISNQSNLRIDQRNVSNSLFILNPLVNDTSILSGNTFGRNTFIYNANKTGLEITNKVNVQRQLLSYGSEEQQKTDHIINGRQNIYSFRQTILQASALFNFTDRVLENRFFSNRNFKWESMLYQFSFTLQNNNQKATLQYEIVDGGGNDGVVSDLKQKSNVMGIIYYYNINTKTNIDINIKQSKINFTGNASTPLGFQVLNGLLPGDNYSWMANIRTLFSKNIQFSMGYEGRKLPELNIIHIGRMEVRYLF